jgi:multicomponent Na+:H+ antiporter subunit G
MDMMAVIGGAGQAIGLVLVGVGLVFTLGAGLGLLRFPDFYTRLHAVTVADPFGSALIALGLVVAAPDAESALRIGLLALLIVVLGPLWSHLLAASAHAGGLAPIAGPYRAPRPGAQQDTPQ